MRIEDFKAPGENILWKGKPNKQVFKKERIYSPYTLVVLVWLLFDLFFILAAIGTGSGFGFILIPFMLFHLMPVWIFVYRIIVANKEWENTEYMVTDGAVYIKSGAFTTNCVRKTFQEITNISLHQGLIDKRYDVGDIYLSLNIVIQNSYNNIQTRTRGFNIIDIEDYQKVYQLITKTSRDIYSDTMYPNDLRPEENHGYNTKYRG